MTIATAWSIIARSVLVASEVVPCHWRNGGPIVLAGDRSNASVGAGLDLLRPRSMGCTAARRPIALIDPTIAPYSVIAACAYAEHEGENLQTPDGRRRPVAR